MPIYEIAALAAAFTWAVTGLVSHGPSRALGAISFSRWRMSIVFVILAIIATLAGTWGTVPPSGWWLIALSGIIGIFLGDTALFMTLNRLGPRATGVLFAANAPMTVLLGWLFLGEILPGLQLLGAIIAFAGIVLAIYFGRSSNGTNRFERVEGHLWVGVLTGIIAALCQAVGALLIRPVMSGAMGDGMPDPIAVSAIRVGLAALLLIGVSFLPIRAVKRKAPLGVSILARTALSGILAMGIGMTLFVFALSGGESGIVATLSATTPVIVLPVLWLATGSRPTLGAWVGAAITVIGTGMIFLA